MLKISESTEIPCQITTNHPALEGRPLSWLSRAERSELDVLTIHNYAPILDSVPKIAEDYADAFQRSVIIDASHQDVMNNEIRECDVLRLGSGASPEELTLLALTLSAVEGQFLTAYFRCVNPHAGVRVGSGYDLLRYAPGGFYREHCDVVHDHPVLGHRRLSFILFVNDDYEGGELYFPRQDVTVWPEKGKAVIFPSGVTHPHTVRPVLKGTRYTVVSWFF